MSCARCWSNACVCPDGHGWRGYTLGHLEQIKRAIDVAIALAPMVEVRCGVCGAHTGHFALPAVLENVPRSLNLCARCAPERGSGAAT